MWCASWKVVRNCEKFMKNIIKKCSRKEKEILFILWCSYTNNNVCLCVSLWESYFCVFVLIPYRFVRWFHNLPVTDHQGHWHTPIRILDICGDMDSSPVLVGKEYYIHLINDLRKVWRGYVHCFWRDVKTMSILSSKSMITRVMMFLLSILNSSWRPLENWEQWNQTKS